MNLNHKPRPELAEKDEAPQTDSNPTFTAVVAIHPLSTIHHPPPASQHSDTPLLQHPVSSPDWALLLQHTEYFAEAEIHGYCWREVSEGVLPSGYDASSVAAEAVEEVFREVAAGSLAPNLKELKRALRRCAGKIINRLPHRMENEVRASECDLNPIFKDYGEVIAPLEMFPGEEPDPAEVLMAKEDAAEFEQLKHQFKALLDRDQLLKDLFACLCAGIIKREAIARELNITCDMVTNAQKRLDRHIAQFKRRRYLKKV